MKHVFFVHPGDGQINNANELSLADRWLISQREDIKQVTVCPHGIWVPCDPCSIWIGKEVLKGERVQGQSTNPRLFNIYDTVRGIAGVTYFGKRKVKRHVEESEDGYRGARTVTVEEDCTAVTVSQAERLDYVWKINGDSPDVSPQSGAYPNLERDPWDSIQEEIERWMNEK